MRSDTLMTPLQVRSSGHGRTGIGRSSWKGHITGRHVKAPVRCPCSRLAALHGAPRRQKMCGVGGSMARF